MAAVIAAVYAHWLRANTHVVYPRFHGRNEMSRYSLLVTLHVASVIVWLGAGTTLVFLTIYAQRARNGVVLEQLGTLVQWMALRVLAPASLAAAGFGAAAAHAGDWPHLFWFQVGEGAFLFSFLLTVVIRLPLLRRARRTEFGAARLSQYLLALALAELTVLYLAVADMVVKPSGSDTSVVRYGGGVLALGLLAAAAIAYRARKIDLPNGVSRLGVDRARLGAGAGSPAPSTPTHPKR
jgi:hypothetical protein